MRMAPDVEKMHSRPDCGQEPHHVKCSGGETRNRPAASSSFSGAEGKGRAYANQSSLL